MADTHSVIGTKNKKGQTFTETWTMMHDAPRTPSFFTGSEVIKEALRRASCDVMIAYPITPQSEAAALIGELPPPDFEMPVSGFTNRPGKVSCSGWRYTTPTNMKSFSR